jgi:hypothetical protein
MAAGATAGPMPTRKRQPRRSSTGQRNGDAATCNAGSERCCWPASALGGTCVAADAACLGSNSADLECDQPQDCSMQGIMCCAFPDGGPIHDAGRTRCIAGNQCMPNAGGPAGPVCRPGFTCATGTCQMARFPGNYGFCQ